MEKQKHEKVTEGLKILVEDLLAKTENCLSDVGYNPITHERLKQCEQILRFMERGYQSKNYFELMVRYKRIIDKIDNMIAPVSR